MKVRKIILTILVICLGLCTTDAYAAKIGEIRISNEKDGIKNVMEQYNNKEKKWEKKTYTNICVVDSNDVKKTGTVGTIYSIQTANNSYPKKLDKDNNVMETVEGVTNYKLADLNAQHLKAQQFTVTAGADGYRRYKAQYNDNKCVFAYKKKKSDGTFPSSWTYKLCNGNIDVYYSSNYSNSKGKNVNTVTKIDGNWTLTFTKEGNVTIEKNNHTDGGTYKVKINPLTNDNPQTVDINSTNGYKITLTGKGTENPAVEPVAYNVQNCYCNSAGKPDNGAGGVGYKSNIALEKSCLNLYSSSTSKLGKSEYGIGSEILKICNDPRGKEYCGEPKHDGVGRLTKTTAENGMTINNCARTYAFKATKSTEGDAKCIITSKLSGGKYQYQTCEDYKKEIMGSEKIAVLKNAAECLITTKSSAKNRANDDDPDSAVVKTSCSGTGMNFDSQDSELNTIVKTKLGSAFDDIKGNANIKIHVCHHKIGAADGDEHCGIQISSGKATPTKFDIETTVGNNFKIPTNSQYYIILDLTITAAPCDSTITTTPLKYLISGTTAEVEYNNYYNGRCAYVRDVLDKKESKLKGKVKEILPECWEKTLAPEDKELLDTNLEEIISDIEKIIELSNKTYGGAGLISNTKTCDFKGYEEANKTEYGYKLAEYSDLKLPTGHAEIDAETYWAAICTETLYVDPDNPKYVEAGRGFEYDSKVNIVRECKPIQLKRVKLRSKCRYGVECYDGIHNGMPAAGPSEDFDKCINKCDKGKYTQKCIDKCYNEVYGDDNKLSSTLFMDSVDDKVAEIASYSKKSETLKSDYIYSKATKTGGACTKDEIENKQCTTKLGNYVSSGCIIKGTQNASTGDDPTDNPNPLENWYWGPNGDWDLSLKNLKKYKDTLGAIEPTVGYNCGGPKNSTAKGIIVNKSRRNHDVFNKPGEWVPADYVRTEHKVVFAYLGGCAMGEPPVECIEVYQSSPLCTHDPIGQYKKDLIESLSQYNDIKNLTSDSTSHNFKLKIDEEFEDGTSPISTVFDETNTKYKAKVISTTTAIAASDDTCRTARIPLKKAEDALAKYISKGSINAAELAEIKEYDNLPEGCLTSSAQVTKFTVGIGSMYIKSTGDYNSTDNYSGKYTLAQNANNMIYNKNQTEPLTEHRDKDYGPFNVYFTSFSTKLNLNYVLKWPNTNDGPYTNNGTVCTTDKETCNTDTKDSMYKKNITVSVEDLGTFKQWHGNLISCFYGTPSDGLGGGDIIFRPINLRNVFPGDESDGIDKDGREARFNWTGTVITEADGKKYTTGAALINHSDADTKFYWNESFYANEDVDPERLILSIQDEPKEGLEKIYQNTQCGSDKGKYEYRIKLTPKDIRAIRNYNRTVGDLNSDGERGTYIDYDMECQKSPKGKPNCVSKLINRFIANRWSLAGCNNGTPAAGNVGTGCNPITESSGLIK